jgi:nitrite reductase (NADH) small subunit
METTLEMGLECDAEVPEAEAAAWFRAAPVEAFPKDGGACIKVGRLQIAVFNFARRGEWFACQNLCPHKREMALSRGLLGSAAETPKVACPFHKAAFSLETGECLSADLEPIRTYPVRVEDGHVLIRLADADAEGLA